MPGLKIYLTALLTLLLVVPSAALALKQGDPLPELAGPTLEGTEFNISSLKGQPILLKVGTTWCPTCGQQTQEIDKLRDFLAENGVRYIEVFVQETAKKVRQFFSKGGHQLPDAVILDQGSIARALNVYVIPRVIMIDKNFQVFRDGNPLTATELKNELGKMLTGQ
ncbi:MAG: redoxin family protein [Deltaproteobacteria bacterium]|nr:redoxin family protein [Deltaproteobacteria bacterium]